MVVAKMVAMKMKRNIMYVMRERERVEIPEDLMMQSMQKVKKSKELRIIPRFRIELVFV